MKLVCPDKRNKPRLDPKICEAKCDRRYECKVYQEAMREQVAQNRRS